MSYIEMNELRIRRKKRNLILVANTTLALVSLLVSAFLTYYNLSLVRETLQLQNSLYNFSPAIIAVSSDKETVFTSSMSRYTINQSYPVYLNGSVETVLKIITPHYGYVHVALKNIYPTDEMDDVQKMINAERRENWGATYLKGIFEDTLVQGLNQMTASLELKISAYLNIDSLRSSNIIYLPFRLCSLELEAAMVDLQTHLTTVQDFNVTVTGQITILD